jgi:transcriptional regulator with XRE-family HTH domain
MAAYLDVERGSLSKYENGKLKFEWIDRAIKLQKLMREAGYDLTDLDKPPTPDPSPNSATTTTK